MTTGLTVIGLALQEGLESPEVGINCTRFVVDYKPEFIKKGKNYQGQTVTRVFPTIPSREFTVEAEEITGASTGLSGATFIADCAALLTNDKAQFGSPVGTIYLDSVTVTQENEGWRTNSYKLSSDPLITT